MAQVGPDYASRVVTIAFLAFFPRPRRVRAWKRVRAALLIFPFFIFIAAA